MLYMKHVRTFIPLALMLNATSALADISLTIDSPNSDVGPIKNFNINIQSDIELKLVEFTPFPTEYCNLELFPYQPNIVSGTEFNQTVTYNYGQHRYASGENLCVYVEDVEGNKHIASSDQVIVLAEPELLIESVETNAINSIFSHHDENGVSVNRVNYIFRQEHVGQNLDFTLRGNASIGTTVALTAFNGDILARSNVSDDGSWQISPFNLSVSSTSVVSSGNYKIKSLLAENNEIILKDERFIFSGEKVVIEILSTPLDPLNTADGSSGYTSWDLQTGLNIDHVRVLLFNTVQSCRNIQDNAVKVFDLANARNINFTYKEEYHGFYACLQIEDREGRTFNEDIGWIRQQAKADIVITDDIENTPSYSDSFSAYINGAENVKIRYLSDQGSNNRQRAWQQCQSRVQGTPINNKNIELILSDKTLHDTYLCLSADNGSGGETYWMSEHKINIIGGNAIIENLQKRIPSTEVASGLAIPPKLQNATVANPGCRAVLLSPDLVMSAAHCQAPFFHPKNGVWAHAGDKIFGFLVAQDEKEHQLFDIARQEIFDYYKANKEKLGLTIDYYREENEKYVV